jgi:hypothetical protein
MQKQAPPWENLSVTITNTWGEGGRINFDDAPIQQPRFRLRGIYLPRTGAAAVLSRYAVDFDAGYMVPWWSGVQLFPMGHQTPSLGLQLPPFDPARAREYRDALDKVRKELSVMNSPLVRLEGYMGVIYPDVPRVDRVQMIYLQNAARAANGGSTDLVYVHFSFADNDGVFAPNEDGGGTGPPK